MWVTTPASPPATARIGPIPATRTSNTVIVANTTARYPSPWLVGEPAPNIITGRREALQEIFALGFFFTVVLTVSTNWGSRYSLPDEWVAF
jgi:hypothetical protein